MDLECTVIIAKAGKNYAAHCSDILDCIATGKTPQETLALYREALEMHLTGLREDGLPIPEPNTAARLKSRHRPSYANKPGYLCGIRA